MEQHTENWNSTLTNLYNVLKNVCSTIY